LNYTEGVLDVIPPSSGIPSLADEARRRERQLAKRKIARVSSDASQSRSVSVGPRTVTVDWKLPARLRRPVRSELARQRRRRNKTESVQFKRRALYSDGVARSSRKNRGAEHHTGDVYRSAKPQLRIETPPYAGAIARSLSAQPPRKRVSGVGAPSRSRQRQVSTTQARSREFEPRPLRVPVANSPTLPARQDSAHILRHTLGLAERDVPFDLNAMSQREPALAELDGAVETESRNEVSLSDGYDQHEVALPRGRFSLPLHFSVWPFGRKNDEVYAAPAEDGATPLRSSHGMSSWGEPTPLRSSSYAGLRTSKEFASQTDTMERKKKLRAPIIAPLT